MNLVFLAAFGRALAATIVGSAVGLFFLIFGTVAVNRKTTESWIGGAPDVWFEFTVGRHSYLLTAECARVAAFLGVFATLYVIVTSASDSALATALSADAEEHVETCLAVRAAYLAAIAPPAPPPTPTGPPTPDDELLVD